MFILTLFTFTENLSLTLKDILQTNIQRNTQTHAVNHITCFVEVINNWAVILNEKLIETFLCYRARNEIFATTICPLKLSNKEERKLTEILAVTYEIVSLELSKTILGFNMKVT